jgi:hypothetical protein
MLNYLRIDKLKDILTLETINKQMMMIKMISKYTMKTKDKVIMTALRRHVFLQFGKFYKSQIVICRNLTHSFCFKLSYGFSVIQNSILFNKVLIF